MNDNRRERLIQVSNISLRKLVKKYGEQIAVNEVSLDIDDGEFLVLLGPSGCGKTSILRCIAGLEDVSGGEIVMSSQVMSSSARSVPPEQRSIGMVFQSYALWPHKSVEENVAFGLQLKKMSATDIKAKVDRALDLVGLTNYAKRGISQLSGGQQQRVALARAVVLEPRVLLFDEPLSNLDAKLREHMRFELRQLQKLLGITAVYVTHDQQEAMVVADRVVLMREGRIEQIGAPAEIYNHPASLFGADFIGLANILPGSVQAGSKVSLAPGIEIECAVEELRVGTAVDLMLRPENLRVSTTALAGTNVFQGKVSHTFFLGNAADVYVDLGNIKLRAQLSPPMLFVEGAPVWLQLPVEAVCLFERE